MVHRCWRHQQRQYLYINIWWVIHNKVKVQTAFNAGTCSFSWERCCILVICVIYSTRIHRARWWTSTSRRRTRRSSSTTCWSCLSQQEAYMKNDLYVHSRELNYLYYIQYVTDNEHSGGLRRWSAKYVRNSSSRSSRRKWKPSARRSSTCNARCAWRWMNMKNDLYVQARELNYL